MNVSAIIVTRGNVDLDPVLESLPDEWERVVWDNSGRGPLSDKSARELYATTSRDERRRMNFKGGPHRLLPRLIFAQPDLSVYGRYAAIEYASHDLIYVQDDDVIVSDPQAIVDAWDDVAAEIDAEEKDPTPDHLVANMPQEFRHDFYVEHCLVGFGACFHRDLPFRAFDAFGEANGNIIEFGSTPMWQRTCDVVFTTLTPRVLVDVPKQDREFASDPDRMWKQPEHHGERQRMLELVRQVRDG